MGKDIENSESWLRKLFRALVEHALKSVITVLIAGVMAWLAIYLGNYYDVIPCGIREWLFGVHC